MRRPALRLLWYKSIPINRIARRVKNVSGRGEDQIKKKWRIYATLFDRSVVFANHLHIIARNCNNLV